MVVEIGEERVKNKDIHRKKKQNLKIQWLGVGDSRKSQKQLCGRGLQGWLSLDKNEDEETQRGKWFYWKIMGSDTEFKVEMYYR